MFGLFKRKGNTPKPPTLEWQLAELAKCGIRLAPDRKIEDLFYSCDREDYESDPFSVLLHVLGGEAENEVGNLGYRFSLDLFDIDTECIYGTGDYVNVIVPFAALAGDDLPITKVSDFVDLEAKQAWIKFELHGNTHHLGAEVNDDWCDPKVIDHFVALAKENRADDSIYIHIDNGQAFTAGYLTKKHFERLCALCPSHPITPLTR